MTTKTIVFTLLVFISLRGFSQQIITDRPDQTESSVTLLKNSFQIESGLLYQNDNSSIKSFSGPSTLLRYGLSDNIELRFVSQYKSNKIGIDGGGDIKTSGFSDLEIGFKVQLFKQEHSKAEVAFLSHAVLPTGTKSFSNEEVGVINKLAISHTVSEQFGLGYNIGYDYMGEQSFLTFSLAIGFGISNSIGFYLEPYGAWGESNSFESNFDAGFTYLVQDNVQLDISYGTGINHDMNYFSLGISWNIPKFLVRKES